MTHLWLPGQAPSGSRSAAVAPTPQASLARAPGQTPAPPTPPVVWPGQRLFTPWVYCRSQAVSQPPGTHFIPASWSFQKTPNQYVKQTALPRPGRSLRGRAQTAGPAGSSPAAQGTPGHHPPPQPWGPDTPRCRLPTHAGDRSSGSSLLPRCQPWLPRVPFPDPMCPPGPLGRSTLGVSWEPGSRVGGALPP